MLGAKVRVIDARMEGRERAAASRQAAANPPVACIQNYQSLMARSYVLALVSQWLQLDSWLEGCLYWGAASLRLLQLRFLGRLPPDLRVASTKILVQEFHCFQCSVAVGQSQIHSVLLGVWLLETNSSDQICLFQRVSVSWNLLVL